MNKNALLAVLILAASRPALAQYSGGAGMGGGAMGGSAIRDPNGRGGSSLYDGSNQGNPASRELAKRFPLAIEGVTTGELNFISASMLLNVKPDEYVAVFAVTEEGKTTQEANDKMNSTIKGFQKSLANLGVKPKDIFVDYIIQRRLYEMKLTDETFDDGTRVNEGPFADKTTRLVPVLKSIARESLIGFEVKKNVSIHFTDSTLVDKLGDAAAANKIYDLVKVDCVVKNLDELKEKLQLDTMALIQKKHAQYSKGLGIAFAPSAKVLVDKPSVYYPMEQYSTYQAAEGNRITWPYQSNVIQLNARKTTTSYFDPLKGVDFDIIINPVVLEPVVQLTSYIKVQYGVQKPPEAARVGFGGNPD